MSQPEQKSVTPLSLAIDAVLVLGFFAYMYGVLKPHVPSTCVCYINIWAALTAACMSGTFWLCIQMFRVVYRAQHASKK